MVSALEQDASFGIKVERVGLGLSRLEALLDQYSVKLMLSISVK